MDKQIQAQLFFTIKWYSKNKQDAYLEDSFADAIDVPCYEWDADKVLVNNEGIKVVTNKAFIVDLSKYAIEEEDEVELHGTRFPVKAIKRYANPFNRKKVTGVVGI